MLIYVNAPTINYLPALRQLLYNSKHLDKKRTIDVIIGCCMFSMNTPNLSKSKVKISGPLSQYIKFNQISYLLCFNAWTLNSLQQELNIQLLISSPFDWKIFVDVSRDKYPSAFTYVAGKSGVFLSGAHLVGDWPRSPFLDQRLTLTQGGLKESSRRSRFPELGRSQ